MPEDREVYEVQQQDDKVCPLRMINARNQSFNPETIQGSPYCKCLKDKCAWWDGLFSKCTIASLIYQLVDIENRL